MELTLSATHTGFNWRALLRWAALCDIAVLLALVATSRDLLSLALAAIILVGWGLSRWRGGLLGILALTGVFADITFYTLTGAVSNLLNGEELLALIIPAILAAASASGVIAAVALLLRRGKSDTGSTAARGVASVAVAFFVLILVAGFFVGGRAKAVARPADLVLRAEGMAYSATALTAEHGQITVHLSNGDLFWHTFTIDELNVDLKVPVRGKQSVTFTVPAGTYTFRCTIPTHEIVGMKGTLTVR